MSKSSDQLAAHCLELLGALGNARSRRMFGGHGLYVDDLFVGLIALDRLYLKVDATTRARFEAASCRPFVYDGAGKAVTMGYYSAPDEAMESPAQMQPWARLALEAALRARAAKPVSAPRRPAATPSATAARPRRTGARTAARKPRPGG